MTRSEELFNRAVKRIREASTVRSALTEPLGKSPDLSTMQTDAIFMMQMETDILITLIPGVP